MRVLFVTPYVPSLIRVRPLNFIKQLSRRHEVVLVTLLQGEKDADAVGRVREYCEKVHAFPLSKVRSLANCCRHLLTRTPLQAAYTDLPCARDFVSRIAESGSFDVLHVEHIRGAHLAESVESVPKVFDSVDCITRLLKLGLAQSRSRLRSVLGYEELLKMRAYEPRITSSFDSVVITSEHDKRALECLIRRFHSRSGMVTGGDAGTATERRLMRSFVEHSQDARLRACMGELAQVSVVRNGVDGDYFSPVAGEVEPGTIVFSGKMSYPPNAMAALRFCNEVFPLIRRERPDARFRIVGSDPPDSLRKLARDPAVEVTGYLPDIRPHLGSAAVVVCPLTVGVGIQNKVLEAMSMARPVVATSLVCSGIPDAVNGRELIRADEPERMAEAVLGLLENPRFGEVLGGNARRFVREMYSWDSAARQLEYVHAQAIDAHRSRVLAAA